MDMGNVIVIVVAALVVLWIIGLVRKVTGWLIHSLLLIALLLLAYAVFTGRIPALS
jgi:hypothetical protein